MTSSWVLGVALLLQLLDLLTPRRRTPSPTGLEAATTPTRAPAPSNRLLQRGAPHPQLAHRQRSGTTDTLTIPRTKRRACSPTQHLEVVGITPYFSLLGRLELGCGSSPLCARLTPPDSVDILDNRRERGGPCARRGAAQPARPPIREGRRARAAIRRRVLRDGDRQGRLDAILCSDAFDVDVPRMAREVERVLRRDEPLALRLARNQPAERASAAAERRLAPRLRRAARGRSGRRRPPRWPRRSSAPARGRFAAGVVRHMCVVLEFIILGVVHGDLV